RELGLRVSGFIPFFIRASARTLSTAFWELQGWFHSLLHQGISTHVHRLDAARSDVSFPSSSGHQHARRWTDKSRLRQFHHPFHPIHNPTLSPYCRTAVPCFIPFFLPESPPPVPPSSDDPIRVFIPFFIRESTRTRSDE